jgi:hypothetical protein
LPVKAAVGSGAPAFAPLGLRMDDKAAARDGMPDLALLSPPVTKSAAEESRRQVVGFAQAATRAAAATAPAAPSLSVGVQSPSQQARKARRCWSTELHRQFVAALNQLGGPQGEPCSSDANYFLPVLGGLQRVLTYLLACRIRYVELELTSSFMSDCLHCSCHPKADQGADEGGRPDKRRSEKPPSG